MRYPHGDSVLSASTSPCEVLIPNALKLCEQSEANGGREFIMEQDNWMMHTHPFGGATPSQTDVRTHLKNKKKIGCIVDVQKHRMTCFKVEGECKGDDCKGKMIPTCESAFAGKSSILKPEVSLPLLQTASCVGAAEWGPKIWAELRAKVEEIPTGTCKEFGHRALNGIQDLVNLKKGETPEKPEDLVWLMRTGYDLARNHAQATKR